MELGFEIYNKHTFIFSLFIIPSRHGNRKKNFFKFKTETSSGSQAEDRLSSEEFHFLSVEEICIKSTLGCL